MSKNGGDNPKPPEETKPAAGSMEFNVDADIARLQRSGHWLAVFWIVLLVAFFGVVAFTLFGYFRIQQETRLPPVVRVVYPVENQIPVYAEPTPLAPAIGLLGKSDRVFEVQKVPGFSKIEKRDLKGWVESDKVKTKLEIIGIVDELRARIRLTLSINMKWEREDLVLHGEVKNESAVPVKNIKVAAHFLDDLGDVLYSDTGDLQTTDALEGGHVAKFSLRGVGMLSRVATVSYEIVDFEAVTPPGEPPAPAAPEGEAPPAPEGQAQQ